MRKQQRGHESSYFEVIHFKIHKLIHLVKVQCMILIWGGDILVKEVLLSLSMIAGDANAPLDAACYKTEKQEEEVHLL